MEDIAYFIYNIDKRGIRYGWGVAKYSTPGNLYENITTNRTPQESYERIFSHLKKAVPVATDTHIKKLLG